MNEFDLLKKEENEIKKRTSYIRFMANFFWGSMKTVVRFVTILLIDAILFISLNGRPNLN